MSSISCLMPTYNKFPRSQELVEEALQSFLLQDYKNAELIICNDCPGQKIAFDHPRVRIINLNCRFNNLGDKLNYLARESQGDLLARWDDDDVHLPWRLSYSYERMQASGVEYYIGGNFWATNQNKTSYEGGAYAQNLFTRNLFDRLGGFPSISFQEDVKFEWAAQASDRAKFRREKVPQQKTYYLYRWATGSEHLSGYGKGGRGWERIGERRVEEGTFTLIPHWREDYVERVRRKIVEYREGQ